MSRKKDPSLNTVTVSDQLPENLFENDTAAQREHARHVFYQQRLWLELIEKADVMFKEAISRVFKESLGRVNRKALARWSTYDYVKFSGLQVDLAPERSRVHLFDGAFVSVRVGMICAECLYGPAVNVVCVKAMEASAPKSLRDAPGPTEEVNCGERAQTGCGLFGCVWRLLFSKVKPFSVPFVRISARHGFANRPATIRPFVSPFHCGFTVSGAHACAPYNCTSLQPDTTPK